MPNQTEAKYTKQLGPMVTPEFAAELEAWAKSRGVSVSQLAREMLEHSLDAQRAAWEAALDTRAKRTAWSAALRAALARTSAQGQKHVTRRRAADDARAGRVAASTSVDV